jgi:RNA polymerase sigma-70 factor (ECF subfamily)
MQRCREFENHIREHQAGLRAFIRALGADDAWVDDLAQEVFLVAYRRMDDFAPGTDFGKWLRAIARRLLANERRKEARHARLLPFAVADLLFEQELQQPVDGPDLERLLPALRECVERLPTHSRELLHRRYAFSENAATLARELHLKADNVRQQLMRIRLLVRQCLEQKNAGGWE